MTSVYSHELSSEDTLLQSSSGNTPLPPSSPASAPAPASFATTDPPAEYGDDDIDAVLSVSNNDNSRSRAASNLEVQSKEQHTARRLERMKKKPAATIKISLYDEPPTLSESSYNHLDPKYMFAVLEQIQIDAVQHRHQQLPPPSPATPVTPTTPQHDRFGYAIPCRGGSTSRSTKSVATSPRDHPVDVTQSQVSYGINKVTGLKGHDSPQSGESVDHDRIEPAIAAGTGDEGIQPYATVNITPMITGHQNINSSAPHKPIEPLYAEVAKPVVIATANHRSDMIDPYATVDILTNLSRKHNVTCATNETSTSCTSTLEMENHSKFNMTTIVTT